MSILLILFGLFSGSLLAVLVGLVGRRYNIGFFWSFIISIVFSPLIGLIVVLLSSKRDDTTNRAWGCLEYIFAAIALLIFITFLAIALSITTVAFLQ